MNKNVVPASQVSPTAINTAKLKHLRKSQRYSQKNIAGMVNISQNYFSAIETGKCNATLDVLVSIAKALGVTVNDLLVDCGTVKHLDFFGDHGLERARLVRWLVSWAAEMNDQVDEGHEPMDIVLDFEDPSRWKAETIRLKSHIKDGVPNLERLIALMAEVPDGGEMEKAG